MKMRRVFLVAVASAAVMGTAGSALAVTGGASSSRSARPAGALNAIAGCLTGSHTLVNVRTARSSVRCTKRQSHIHWNVTGPRGARGPQGPSGVVSTQTFDLGGVASVATGGSFVTNSTEVGTMDLKAGTYLISANAKVTSNVAQTVGVHPEFFLYNQAVNPQFAGDVFNFGDAALPLGNTSIDTYASGSTVLVVPAHTTFHWVAFGYDDDRGASTYTLDNLTVTATQIKSGS